MGASFSTPLLSTIYWTQILYCQSAKLPECDEANDCKRAIMSQWSKHKNGESFMLMESSVFVHFKQHKWQKNSDTADLIVPSNNIFLENKAFNPVVAPNSSFMKTGIRFTKPYNIWLALPAELKIIWMLMNECVHHWMEISRKELCRRELRTAVTIVYPASEQNWE